MGLETTKPKRKGHLVDAPLAAPDRGSSPEERDEATGASAPAPPRGLLGRRWVRAVAGLVVAGGCIALALRRVEPAAVVEAFRQADLPLLGAAVLLFLAAQVARAGCWSLLAGRTPRLPLLRSVRLLLAGHLANLVVPMRGGEVARIWLLARRGRIGSGRATAVVVVERTVDLLVLLCIIWLAAAVVGLPDWLGQGVWKLALAGGIAVAGLGVLLLLRSKLGGLATRLAGGRGPAGLAGRLVGRLAEGMGMLRARSAAAGALALVVSWALVLAGLELRLRAFGIETPTGGALAALAAGNVAATVPVVPAGIGVFEYTTMLVLETMGVDGSLGLAFAAASHGLTILIIAFAGGLALAVDGALERLERDPESAEGEDQA